MRTLHLASVSHERPTFIAGPEFTHIDSLPLRALGAHELMAYDSILIPSQVDQRALVQHRPTLIRFLNQGGTLVINGHIAYDFCPGLSFFVPTTHRKLDALRIERVAPHPIFDGVDTDDLTFRKGIAGFYGRGSNPPPQGAIALHVLQLDRLVVDWLWQRPDGGRILMHSGNDLWMYAENDSRMYAKGGNSAARIAPQLLSWLANESIPC